jgi:hypothetical protein
MRDRPPGLARMPSWAEGHAAVARRVVPGLPRDGPSGKPRGVRRITCRPRRSAARANQTTLPGLPFPVRGTATLIRCSGSRG